MLESDRVMPRIDGFFEEYEWSYEQLEERVWRSSFATEGEDDFDVYVMEDDEYLYFAVSPFVSDIMSECAPRLFRRLLQLNQQMRLVYFGVDDDGDINLLAELSVDGLCFEQFAAVLDALTHYSEMMARDLTRLASDVDSGRG